MVKTLKYRVLSKNICRDFLLLYPFWGYESKKVFFKTCGPISIKFCQGHNPKLFYTFFWLIVKFRKVAKRNTAVPILIKFFSSVPSKYANKTNCSSFLQKKILKREIFLIFLNYWAVFHIFLKRTPFTPINFLF